MIAEILEAELQKRPLDIQLQDSVETPEIPTKPTRTYVGVTEANQIAGEKYKQLWRIDNKSEWARQIGCHRETVGKLPKWQKAENLRKGHGKIAARLNRDITVVDPAIIEAICTGDSSALGKLSAEEREKIDSLSDTERSEIIELLTDQSHDAVS